MTCSARGPTRVRGDFVGTGLPNADTNILAVLVWALAQEMVKLSHARAKKAVEAQRGEILVRSLAQADTAVQCQSGPRI